MLRVGHPGITLHPMRKERVLRGSSGFFGVLRGSSGFLALEGLRGGFLGARVCGFSGFRALRGVRGLRGILHQLLGIS